MKHLLSTCLFLLLLGLQLQAQDKLAELPFRIAILDENVALPNSNWLDRYSFNPGIMIGTDYTLKAMGSHALILGGNLGFYHHQGWQSTVFLSTELGYQFTWKRWNASLRAGVGYAHSFTPGTLYIESEGGFAEARDTGYPAFMPSATITLGYRLGEGSYSPELFAQATATAEFPLTIYTGAHQFVGLGVKFYPFINK